MSRSYDTLIVGAGVSGLVLGWKLSQQGKRVAIVESSSQVGGVVSTRTIDGFLIERGPNTVLAKPELRQLLGALGLKDRIVYASASANKRYIACQRGGKTVLEALPRGFGDLWRSSLLSVGLLARALLEPFMPRTRAEDQDVEAYVTRRFGKSVARNLVGPMLSGIWAADISRLSARSALERLWRLESSYGSVLYGAVRSVPLGRKKTCAETQQIGKGMVSFIEGLAELPNVLASQYRGELFLEADVAEISYNAESVGVTLNKGASLEKLVCKQVVFTGSAECSAGLLRPLDPQLAEEILKVPYAPVGVMHVVVDRSEVGHALDGFGFLVQPHLGFALLGTIFSSSIFPDRARDGKCLLTCFCGGALRPELADVRKAKVREQALAELCGLLDIQGAPHVLSESVWDKAIPNFALGHYKLEERISVFEREHPGLYVLANWRKGISVADRVREAMTLADEL